MMLNSIATPESSRILSLTSPSFQMKQPKLVHGETIPPGILGAMQPTWRTSRFPERPVTISLLHAVYVVQEGLVFDANGNLYAGSITQHGPAEIEQGYEKVRQAMRAGDGAPVDGTLVLCKKRGAMNFGHWMMEMLPKAYLARLYLPGDGLRYLVPALAGPLQGIVSDSLGMFNIDGPMIVPADGGVVSASSLVLIEGLTDHGVYMSPIVMGCLDGLSARVPGHGHGRLLVTRGGMKARRLLNEEAVHARALEHGYTIIDTSSMSLAEQIAHFKNATHVVGVMGAAMTNITFAPRNARITNLAPTGMPDTFFWFIAGLRSQQYEEIRCEQSGPITGVADWDRDMTVRPEDLDLIFDDRS